MIPDQSAGNAPLIQPRLIGRKFKLKLGFVIRLPEVSPRDSWSRVSPSGDAVIQLLFHRGSQLLMELARSQRSDVAFRIALRSRCGQMVELSFRVCLAFLPLVKCRLLRPEYLETLFRVASRREPRAELLLPWRADLAIWPAKPMLQAGAIWLRETMKLPPVSWRQPAKQSYLLLSPHPLLSWRRLL